MTPSYRNLNAINLIEYYLYNIQVLALRAGEINRERERERERERLNTVWLAGVPRHKQSELTQHTWTKDTLFLPLEHIIRTARTLQ
jgi:hypothetical protein